MEERVRDLDLRGLYAWHIIVAITPGDSHGFGW